VPVVCHDPTVDRTTTGSGRIHDLTWSEIRRLDAGARCSQAWSGTRVPCFDQVLEAVGGRLDLNIHIKEPGPDGVLVRLVCDRLRDLRLSSSAYIAGDCEATLQTALECAPEIARACLVAQEDPLAQVQAAREYRCRRVQFGRHVSVDAIRAAHDAGLVCNLFWSDEVEDTLAFARLGIDVILTNCLHRLVDDPRLRDNA
jgi:glycerophosphoryl diester phosphodiesterase